MFPLALPFARTSGLFLGAVALAALSACGGGGGTDSTAGAVAAETALSGTVKDATTLAAISGATISVGLKSSATPATAFASADGSYALKLSTSTLNTAASAVVTVTASNYMPCSMEVSGLQANGEARSLTDCSRLSAVPSGTYAPAEGAVITRLGNNSATTGDALSQLSTVASKTSVDIKIGAVNQGTAGSNTNFVTSLKIRGMEPRNCADKITLYQVATTPLLVAQGSTGLVDSDATGAFMPYSFRLPVSALAATGDLYIRIESGACGAAPADAADDFEIYGLTGSFTS